MRSPESGGRPPSAEVAAAYGKMFLQLGGLIERWAEHVRRVEGSFPKFFLNWVDAEKNATALFHRLADRDLARPAVPAQGPALIPGEPVRQRALPQLELQPRPLLRAQPFPRHRPPGPQRFRSAVLPGPPLASH
jgi:hypothetical protein